MVRWIDTHCHLDAKEFSTLALSERALAARNNVVHCVFPAVHTGNFTAVRELAHRHGDSYCLGIHPLFVAQAGDDALALLEETLQQHRTDPQLVAVGEIGLDYFVPELCTGPLRERQQHYYLEQLRLAQRYQLPVVLHSRRAVDQVLKGLRDVAGRAGRWHGIAHAFNGSLQQAEAFMSLGLKLGFGGAFTYPRALQLRRLAVALPLNALVLETDAPDMPPRWLFKTVAERAAGALQAVNSPAELPQIGAELAALRGISVDALAQVTTDNALAALPKMSKLFKLPALGVSQPA